MRLECRAQQPWLRVWGRRCERFRPRRNDTRHQFLDACHDDRAIVHGRGSGAVQAQRAQHQRGGTAERTWRTPLRHRRAMKVHGNVPQTEEPGRQGSNIHTLTEVYKIPLLIAREFPANATDSSSQHVPDSAPPLPGTSARRPGTPYEKEENARRIAQARCESNTKEK